MNGPHVLVFDLSQQAHLPSYLRHLITFWRQHRLAGQLDILVWPTFLRDHGDVVLLAESSPLKNVRFLALTAQERRERLARQATDEGIRIRFHELVKSEPSTAYAALVDWELLCRRAVETAADRIFVVSLDPYLPLLAAGFDCPLPISGICFGPTFHHAARVRSPGPEVRALREKYVFARALASASLATLFLVDPAAAAALARFPHGDKAVYVADPVDLPPASAASVAAWADRLGVEPGRKRFLLFGHLTPRKGVEGLLSAVEILPDAVTQRMCLMLVGPIDPEYEPRLARRVEQVSRLRPVQVVRQPMVVPDEEVAACFQLADFVVTPYVGHLGSSGVLLLAAAAGKPLLSTDQGWMGEMVRRHRLGLAVDASSPQEIAAGLTHLLTDPSDALCDRRAMHDLARQHSARDFAGVIFRQLGAAPCPWE